MAASHPTTSTVGDLKQLRLSTDNWPVDKQRAIFNGAERYDHERLNECGTVADSTVEVHAGDIISSA